jgi:hypothetical protein
MSVIDMPASEEPERQWAKSQKPMHDVTNRDSRSGKKTTDSACKENGNANYFSSPRMN